MNERVDDAGGDEAEVDAVLAEFNGNARDAIKALLHDVDVLARGYDASVSRGFVRRPARTLVARTGREKGPG